MINVEKEIYDDWIKTHPSAKGLFKNPFPFFDELAPIFGKEVATEERAEGPEDAVQQMEKEAAVYDESGNLADDFFEQMLDPTQSQNYCPMPEPTTEEGPEVHSPVSVTVTKKGKKRARSEDVVIGVVSEAMDKLTQSHTRTTNKIDNLVGCFKHKAEDRELRRSILEELKQIEGLNTAQRVKVAMIMGRDRKLTDDNYMVIKNLQLLVSPNFKITNLKVTKSGYL
ncbi:uncharacterized protein LOC133312749 [Gastrolobium bilobum]|uniref:uncharacterized protein LOC133312749 n=1 Tax=Gastrolobium bilobum TaxID=150636 RepID=UPI002AB280EA|nr:uncharacterized protein LOC133312749 [Gastrolobium bilobum]